MTPLSRFTSEFQKLELYAVGRVLALSTVVGVVAGCGAIVFQLLCRQASHIFLGGLVGFKPGGPAGEPDGMVGSPFPLRLWMIPVAAALGGLLAGLIVQRFAPEAAGHGTDDVVDAFHRRRGFIRWQVPIVKTLASALTLGSGGSGGREGPIAQIGAGFGSFLGRRLSLPERERRILLASGVGAGVGSIFRAPLAGALFSAEVLYSDPDFESEVIIPAALASIVAYCTFSLKFGFGVLFSTPDLRFRSAFELLPYTALALAVSLCAGLFVKVFYGIHGFFQRLAVPAFIKPAIGGLVTGGLAIAFYSMERNPHSLDTLSFGYGSVQDALLGNIPLAVLLLIAGGKLLTTSFSIGSGGSGGVFGPSMVIGGTLGGAIGIIAGKLFPSMVTQPATFVPVGMAGFFAAAANTPISSLIIVSEMTGNYNLLLPTLWVCAISYLVGRRWTLYRSQVAGRADSAAHRETILAGVLRSLQVGDVMTDRTIHVLPESASLAEVLDAFLHSSQQCLPVVSRDGTMVGCIMLEELRRDLDEHRDNLPLVAHDLVSRSAPRLWRDDRLDTALDQMVLADVAELPIVEAGDGNKVVGLLSRRDIIAFYSRRRIEK